MWWMLQNVHNLSKDKIVLLLMPVFFLFFLFIFFFFFLSVSLQSASHRLQNKKNVTHWPCSSEPKSNGPCTLHDNSIVFSPIYFLSFQCLHLPLGLKYGCASQTTWMQAINSLLLILNIGIPIARKHGKGLFLTLVEFILEKKIYRWLSARLQYLHCISNGDTAVLH